MAKTVKTITTYDDVSYSLHVGDDKERVQILFTDAEDGPMFDIWLSKDQLDTMIVTLAKAQDYMSEESKNNENG